MKISLKKSPFFFYNTSFQRFLRIAYCCFLAGTLQGLFEEVEDALFHLEDVLETQKLREQQLDHRFQFALYKEKRLAELEHYRSELNSSSFTIFLLVSLTCCTLVGTSHRIFVIWSEILSLILVKPIDKAYSSRLLLDE